MNEDQPTYPTDFWQTLRNRRNSFRVFRPYSLPGSSDIYIELIESRFTRKPLYDAISYTWGEPGHEQPVYTADGRFTMIRNNLWQCLRELCNRSHSTLLWADALCINQIDPVEKSQQVQMIGKIFRGAQRVLAWLGEGDDDTDTLFQAVQEDFIDENDQQFYRERPPAVSASVVRYDGLMLERKWRNLLAHEYWKRAWIVQECMLARNILILCGRSAMTWAQFFGFQPTLHCDASHPEPRSNSSLGLPITYSPFKLAGARYGGWEVPINMYSMLKTFKDTNCFDRRDKLFAFLEILEEGQSNHPGRLLADYSITPAKVYFRAFHAYLRSYPKNVSIFIGTNLRETLSLTAEEIEHEVNQTVDRDRLPLPLKYITGEQAETRHSSNKVVPHPNRLDPERVYNLLEIYAACFEYLATGKLEHTGRIMCWQMGWPKT